MERIFNQKGQSINMDELQLVSKGGGEVIVYKYLDTVIKLYKNNVERPHLSVKQIDFFSTLSPKRILLPTGSIFNDNQELIGYQMPYIGNERKLLNDKTRQFFAELEIIREDLKTIGDKSIVLFDINVPNTVYNGGLYLVDPGNYYINVLNFYIIYHTNNKKILEEVEKIFLTNDFDRVDAFIASLSQEERNSLITEWNYAKINELINSLIFNSAKIDFTIYRQIIKFIGQEKEKNNLNYNLDVLKMYFNENLSVEDSVDEFIRKYIKDDPEERKLLLTP